MKDMKKSTVLLLAWLFFGVIAGPSSPGAASPAPSPATGGLYPPGWGDIDQALTKKVGAILTECEKIKPGMTRAQLLKVFTTEGGLSGPRWRKYVSRRCPIIKVDVEFKVSDPKQDGERPGDIITKISTPYLEWTIID
jgi:hypothetical protein